MSRRVAALALLLGVVAILVGAGDAQACAVCWGNVDSPIIDGVKASIAFMGALVYLVLGGGAVAMVVIRRKALAGAAGEAAPPSSDKERRTS